MPQFSYKAKSFKGKEENGIIEAVDELQLAKFLKQKGYFLVSATLDTKKTKKSGNKTLDALEGMFGVPLADKLFFTRNLEVMIKAGVSLPRAFSVLSKQTKSKKFKKALSSIGDRIVKGESISDCLGAHPSIFSNLYTETMKIGEETGKLEDALHILSIQMEREHKIKSDIVSAMIYPVVVLVMATFIGVFMFLFAVPKLKESFVEMDVKLPFTTKAMFAFVDFLIIQWPFAVFLILVLILALFLFIKSKKTTKAKSVIFLKIPVIRKITKVANSALTLRTLSSLLSAGVPIVKSLRIASGALKNYYFKESLIKAAGSVEKGGKLSESLKEYEEIYSPVVMQMMEVGEETGETPQVLGKLAEFYEEEVAISTKKLSSVIEPFLILVIGGIVGFFAISMMQPMFSMMGGV